MSRTNFQRAFMTGIVGAALAACSSETSDPDSPPAELETVRSFDASQYELAEGLAVHQGKAYVGLAPLGKILAIDANGDVSNYASVPAGYDKGYTLGLTFDSESNLYVAATRNSPDATDLAPGVFKIPPGGADVKQPFASHPEMTFPNGVAIDESGVLFVTDSALGAIFTVNAEGSVSKWSTSPELSGSPACPGPLPFPIGANGIVVTSDHVFVTNTAKGSLVAIERGSDGSAGAVTTLVQDCGYVGFDGLARDEDGSFVVAQNGAPGRVLRVTGSGQARVLHEGAPADGPASVAFVPEWNGSRALLLTSSAFFSVGVDGMNPNPSLASYGPLAQ